MKYIGIPRETLLKKQLLKVRQQICDRKIHVIY